MNKNPRPSVPQLRAWQADEITMWIFKQVNNRYPKPTGPFPLITPEQVHRFNHQIGSREVVEYIDKICRSGDAS